MSSTKTTRRTAAGTAAAKQPGFVMPRDFTAKEIATARDIPGARAAVTNLFGDPVAEAKKIFARVGDLSGIKLFGNRVLVAKFERTMVGSSGTLYAAPKTQLEDQYQGKVGLVLKVGPTAFVDDEAHGLVWNGDSVKPGDWIFYAYADGTDMDIVPIGSTDKVHCKLLREGDVNGIVPRPDFLF